MTTRRSFLKTATIASAAIIQTPHFFEEKKKVPVGLQLYTVRSEMEKDVALTLNKIAEIGFKTLEGATYTGTQQFYGMSPKAFKKMLAEYELTMVSSHYMLGEDNPAIKGTLVNGWQKAVDDAAELGLKYMVCAYLTEKERGNIEQYKRIAAQLNVAGAVAKRAGIQLCYHNHDFEFVHNDDKLPYEVLLNDTSVEMVKMELDLYWMYKAKQDPIALFQKYPGRFPLWHIKDMDATASQNFTEAGSGIIPFKEIFTHAKKAGLKYFFNEQDTTPGDPFISIEKSFRYIRDNLI